MTYTDYNHMIDEVNTLIESIHPDGTPMYQKYIMSIIAWAHVQKEEAIELFHVLYARYVDIEHHDRFKYKNDQLVVFSEYIHAMCLEHIRQRIKREDRDDH